MKWIPVSELPKEDGRYLVHQIFCRRKSYMQTLYFAKHGEDVNEYDLVGQENVWYAYDSEAGYYPVGNITHWMPLPEPPKEF